MMKFTFWLPFLFLLLAPLTDSVVTESGGNLGIPVTAPAPAPTNSVVTESVDNLARPAIVPVLAAPVTVHVLAPAPSPGTPASSVVTELDASKAPPLPATAAPVFTGGTDGHVGEAALRERVAESIRQSKEVEKWKKVFDVVLDKITRANKPH